jgi:hypothetical protein
MHRRRAASLTAGVGGLLRGGKLTLSHLGRALCGASHAKHKIKRVDRLLGNSHLHRERAAVYRAFAQWLLRGVERPVILVDWSDCAPGHEWLMLSAALALGGRAIPLYEEVHRLASYNSPRTDRRFLEGLKGVLPTSCRPILITDAGFRGPWFRAVEKLGWDWVGRVRNRIKVPMEGTETWRYTTSLYEEATGRVRHLGRCSLSHKHLKQSALCRAFQPGIYDPVGKEQEGEVYIADCDLSRKDHAAVLRYLRGKYGRPNLMDLATRHHSAEIFVPRPRKNEAT